MQIEDGLNALVCHNGGVFGSASKQVERIRMGRWRGDDTLSSTKDGGSFKGEM